MGTITKKKVKELSTLNVVEVICEELSLTAFPNTKTGRKNAEKLFTQILVEDGVEEKDVKDFLKLDFYNASDTFQVHIVHSR